MIDENANYIERVINHYKIQSEVALDLLMILQKICPGTFVITINSGLDGLPGQIPEKVYIVSVTNGDDNVTCSNKNLGAALSETIYRLMNGSIFPLTGNMGVYVHPLDCGWVKAKSSEVKKEKE